MAASSPTSHCFSHSRNCFSPNKKLYSFSSNLPTSLNHHPFEHLISSPISHICHAISTTIHGVYYVVGNNIDTDQTIPTEYLTLVLSNPDEYRKLGCYFLISLPFSYQTRCVDLGEHKSKFFVVIIDTNFGCNLSSEHTPVMRWSTGTKAMVEESYARILFRNTMATGEVYPLESEGKICEECRISDVVTIKMREGYSNSRLINHMTGKEYKLKSARDNGPVIQVGRIFAYARKSGIFTYAYARKMGKMMSFC